MRYRLLNILILLSIFSIPSFGENGKYYDEVFDNNGKVREHYKKIFEWVSGLSKKAYKNFIKESEQRLSGDTPMAPMLRELTVSEFETLKKGTEQRSAAIQAFLIDHYSGNKSYRDKVIPGPIIDQIIARTGEGPLEPMLRGQKNFRYLYGPDVIRNKDGGWYVLEDNLGFVGGTPGDTIPAREVYESMTKDIFPLLSVQNDPNQFLNQLMDRINLTANPKLGKHNGEGEFVFLSSPPYGDKEDVRMAEQFKKHGAILVTTHTRNGNPNAPSKNLVVRADGVYLQERTHYGKEYEKKVGFIWMNAEHAWLDPHDPYIRTKALLEEARGFLDDPKVKEKTKQLLNQAMETDSKTGQVNVLALERALQDAAKSSGYNSLSVLTSKAAYPGLVRAILEGKVSTNYTPGVEFVGDKMFHSYMEDIIQFYLNEKPILRNPRTRRYFKIDKTGNIVPDEKVFSDLLKSNQWVDKIVDGRGGDGISIGPKMNATKRNKIPAIVRNELTRHVQQDYEHLSVINDGHNKWIGDIRLFSYVDENGTLVSGTPWGRLNLVSGDGLVNMSKNGTLALVAIVPDPITCKTTLKKLLKK